MSVTESYFRQYYESLYNNKEIYVWGANHELITQSLMDKCYRNFGSVTYNKAYYQNKLIEGAGHYGSDCSGSFYPLSKADNTARGYYGICSKKGSISTIPINKCCMVFNSSFTHIGAYLGNGITVEMRSSKLNCWRENLNKSRWAYWGIPSWLIEDAKPSGQSNITDQKPLSNNVIKKYQEWLNKHGQYNLSIDGNFGPRTHKASVMEFQKLISSLSNASLSIDGDFGPKTKAACPVFRKGSKGDGVIIIQAMLASKGYYMASSINNDMFDGYYGNETAKIVRLFQSSVKGLRYDGEAGPATCYALFN